jgi:hypothetical protein
MLFGERRSDVHDTMSVKSTLKNEKNQFSSNSEEPYIFLLTDLSSSVIFRVLQKAVELALVFLSSRVTSVPLIHDIS